jgi:hypothetical protein
VREKTTKNKPKIKRSTVVNIAMCEGKNNKEQTQNKKKYSG